MQTGSEKLNTVNVAGIIASGCAGMFKLKKPNVLLLNKWLHVEAVPLHNAV